MKSLLDDSQMLAVTGDCTLSKRFLEFVVYLTFVLDLSVLQFKSPLADWLCVFEVHS